MRRLPPSDSAPPPVAAAGWHRALAEAPVAPAGLFAGSSLLVIAAHPDDEVIGVGRLLAEHEDAVRCVSLTAGELCHGPAADLDDVARTRLSEWSAALALLGAEPVETARWSDGALSGHEQEAVEMLCPLAADGDVVLAPWRYDPHPDHEAAGRIGAAVSRRSARPLWAYLVWTPYWLTPAELDRRGAEVVQQPTSEQAKLVWRDALACHRSQLTARPPASQPIVPSALIDRHARQLLIRETHDSSS